MGKTKSDDSAVLAALIEDNDQGQIKPPHHRPIKVVRHSWHRNLTTYGSAVVGFLTLFASGIWAYSNLCRDVENNTNAVQQQAVTSKEAAKKTESNTKHIQQMKVTLQRVDTTQQEMKDNFERRMNRQDAALDRILQKLDNR